MKRRALIIYCDDTRSGKLNGPSRDNKNFREFLQSNLGGAWYDKEILSLRNPSSQLVIQAVNEFLNGADYTFTIFTGHGFINTNDNNIQYIELSGGAISIANLSTSAKRQTLIVDACRGFFSPSQEILKGLSEQLGNFIGDPYGTRVIFDKAVLRAEEGWTIMYAASQNQTALDTSMGAAYLLSLIRTAEIWEDVDKKNIIFPINALHKYAKLYLSKNFDAIQIPALNPDNRQIYFPFAVKMREI